MLSSYLATLLASSFVGSVAAQAATGARDLDQKLNVGYFGAWTVYQGFDPRTLDPSDFSHIIYGFLTPTAEGEVKPSEPRLDLNKGYYSNVDIPTVEGQAGDETAMEGNYQHLYLMKKKNNQLKTMVSVGGWLYSVPDGGGDSLWKAWASVPAKRAVFIEQTIEFLDNHGLDGVDIDWEWLDTPGLVEDDMQNLVDLVKELSTAFNETGSGYLISIALQLSSDKIEEWTFEPLLGIVDFWNLMAYDYASDGFTSPCVALPAANLREFPNNKYDTESGLEAFLTKATGIDTRKLALGIPLYARPFQDATALGGSCTEVPGDLFQPKYKDIDGTGNFDNTSVSAWTVVDQTDPSKKTLLSYDNIESVEEKLKYIAAQNLGGAVYWEVSGDFPSGHADRIITHVKNSFGQLDSSPAKLDYPDSKYPTLRDGMPGLEAGFCPGANALIDASVQTELNEYLTAAKMPIKVTGGTPASYPC